MGFTRRAQDRPSEVAPLFVTSRSSNSWVTRNATQNKDTSWCHTHKCGKLLRTTGLISEIAVQHPNKKNFNNFSVEIAQQRVPMHHLSVSCCQGARGGRSRRLNRCFYIKKHCNVPVVRIYPIDILKYKALYCASGTSHWYASMHPFFSHVSRPDPGWWHPRCSHSIHPPVGRSSWVFWNLYPVPQKRGFLVLLQVLITGPFECFWVREPGDRGRRSSRGHEDRRQTWTA